MIAHPTQASAKPKSKRTRGPSPQNRIVIPPVSPQLQPQLPQEGLALTDAQAHAIEEFLQLFSMPYTGGRTQEQLKALEEDPAHSGSTRATDIAKGKHEAEVGLGLEQRGLLRGIRRDPTGYAEFIDETGQKWDVKSFNSKFPPKKGGFDLRKAMTTINDSLDADENVIVDASNMSQEHIEELRQALEDSGIMDKILFWP